MERIRDKDVYEIIETLNYDYITLKQSREFTMGDKLIKTCNFLRKLKIATLFRKAVIHPYAKKAFSYRVDMSPPILIHAPLGGKTVVYACIAGPYDLPKEPFYVESGVDYVLYTDQPKVIKDTAWQYREIPKKILESSPNGKVRSAYIKMHPHEFFSEYDYAIYIDSSMRIMSDVSSWTSLISSKAGIAAHAHSYHNNCIYKEIKHSLSFKRGCAVGLREQMAYYRNEGVPKNIGRLLESTVITTDLRNPESEKILEFWWQEFSKWNSQRDQAALAYILWKMEIAMSDIGTLGSNVWRNPKLRQYPHEMTCYHLDKVGR